MDPHPIELDTTGPGGPVFTFRDQDVKKTFTLETIDKGLLEKSVWTSQFVPAGKSYPPTLKLWQLAATPAPQ